MFYLLRKEPFIFSMEPTSISLVLFTLFSCLSIFWANTTSEAFFENTKLALSLFVFIIATHLFSVRKETFLAQLCRLSVLLIYFELAIAIYQLSKLASFQKEALYQVYGFNSHKNLFSSFILLLLPFSIISIKKFKPCWKFAPIISTLGCLALLVFLRTKAVWVGLLVSVLVYVSILLYKKIKTTINPKVLIGCMVIFSNIFFIFILPKIVQKTLVPLSERGEQKQELDQERLALWQKTYNTIRKHPIAGVGAGNWQIYFPKAGLSGLWRAEDLNYTFQRPHNDFLWIFSETGIIGFNLYLFFLISLTCGFLHFIKTQDLSKEELVQHTILLSVIPGFFTASFFDFPKERVEHILWLHLVLAYCFSFIQIKIAPQGVLKRRFLKYGAMTICVLSVWIGWLHYTGEYHVRKMYDQKARNNFGAIIYEGNKALSFAYRIDPTSLPIKWYTGNAFASQGNFEAAKSDFIAALSENPNNRNVLNDLGSAYAKLHRDDSALYYYKESSLISPRFDDAKFNAFAIFIRQKHYKSADSCLKTLLHISEKRNSYQNMIEMLRADQSHIP